MTALSAVLLAGFAGNECLRSLFAKPAASTARTRLPGPASLAQAFHVFLEFLGMEHLPDRIREQHARDAYQHKKEIPEETAVRHFLGGSLNNSPCWSFSEPAGPFWNFGICASGSGP